MIHIRFQVKYTIELFKQTYAFNKNEIAKPNTFLFIYLFIFNFVKF